MAYGNFANGDQIRFLRAGSIYEQSQSNGIIWMRENKNNIFQDEVPVTSWVNIVCSQKCTEACEVPGVKVSHVLTLVAIHDFSLGQWFSI